MLIQKEAAMATQGTQRRNEITHQKISLSVDTPLQRQNSVKFKTKEKKTGTCNCKILNHFYIK